MRRILYLVAMLLLLHAPSSAQAADKHSSNPFNLSVESVDPVGDSLVIEKMRRKMEVIRKKRPTVALVLSGGGAKGAAHVGVLKYLEEAGIPIDMIFGTSMGGLIGGLYALGHDAASLDTLVSTADWPLLLSNKVNPRRMSYSRKIYRNRYALEIPFKYDSETLKDAQGRDIKLGAGDSKFLSSLPSGYISGLNVNEIFTALSVGYHGNIDFTELPIPFFCVASDLVSGKAKNWSSGSIVTAMRSTMSIPGLFTPVRVDGMVLMDGGTRNNFPTDLARAMGADIIIGVELSDKDKTFEEVNNIGDVIMQSVTMLGSPAFEKNVGGTDVFIKPDLTGYNMLSFDSKSVCDIIQRGYDAARAQASALVWVKSMTKSMKQVYQAFPAKDLRSDVISIGTIVFDGVYDDESRYLSERLPFSAGDKISGKELRDALSMIYATGAFKSVQYQLIEGVNGYVLSFDCVKGPIHRFGLGGRLDTKEFANVYLNMGINAYKLTGSTYDFTLRLGQSFGAGFKYYYDVPNVPTINFEATAYRPEFVLENSDMQGIRTAYWDFSAKAYLSNLKSSLINWKIGTRYDYFEASKAWISNQDTDILSIEKYKMGLGSLFADGSLYTLDNKAFPTTGTELNLGYRWGFAGHGPQYFGQSHMAYLNLETAFGFTPAFALLLYFDTRLNINMDETSFFTANYVGGDMRGRYFEQQIPFVGLVNPVLMKDYFMSIQLEPRVNIWKKLYGSVIGGVMKDNDKFLEQMSTVLNVYWGGGLCIGYDSFLGPFKITGAWNSLMSQWTVYASLGFDF